MQNPGVTVQSPAWSGTISKGEYDQHDEEIRLKPVLHTEISMIIIVGAQEEKFPSLMIGGEAEIEGHLKDGLMIYIQKVEYRHD